MRFAGKRAVVTGGASGIGRATALRFAEEGAEAIVGDIDQAGDQALAGASNGQIAFRRTDVTRAEDIAALVAAAQPIARPGRPEDVAAAVGFLASDDAAFVTGTSMLVDGGLTIGQRHAWDPTTPSLLSALEPFAA